MFNAPMGPVGGAPQMQGIAPQIPQNIMPPAPPANMTQPFGANMQQVMQDPRAMAMINALRGGGGMPGGGLR